eukprot:889910_1
MAAALEEDETPCSDATKCLDDLIQKCELWNERFLSMSKLPSAVSRTAGIAGVSESRSERMKTKSTPWVDLWGDRNKIRDFFTNNLEAITANVKTKGEGGKFTMRAKTKKKNEQNIWSSLRNTQCIRVIDDGILKTDKTTQTAFTKLNNICTNYQAEYNPTFDWNWQTNGGMGEDTRGALKIREYFRAKWTKINEDISTIVAMTGTTEERIFGSTEKTNAKWDELEDKTCVFVIDDAYMAEVMDKDLERWKSWQETHGVDQYPHLTPARWREVGGSVGAHEALYGDLFEDYDDVHVRHSVRLDSESDNIDHTHREMVMFAIGLLAITGCLFVCCVSVWGAFLYVFKRSNDNKGRSAASYDVISSDCDRI